VWVGCRPAWPVVPVREAESAFAVG
jgi:hypothetical protein